MNRTTLPLAGLLVMALLPQARAGTAGVNTSTSVLTATITQGTCEVSFPTVAGGVLSLPPVSRNTLNGGSLQSVQAVPVQVSGCESLNGTGQTPILSVTGPTVTDLPADTGKYLFNNQEAGAARGYGIVLSTEALSSWTPASQVSGDGSATSEVVLGEASQPYVGGTKTLYVGVGCGDATTCAAQDGQHAGGDITVAITFTFGYR
ncbi:fimbrial protein [Enterobacter cloacae]|uniref:fimbrial protein n=1 Tax=Enterobacter cloacae TaxID=550 RepID=UPI002B204E1F|nr:hypothetical protein [Enterobacter cloacae]MEA5217579.1 hypothetical protein [Enterobacter cloacae]